MKLELKHLAPYLPYELNLVEGKLSSISCRWGTVRYVDTDSDDYNTSLERIKPILKSLSECTDINSPFLSSINADLPIQMQICDLANKRIGYWNCCYEAINIMSEHHLDFFGLIDAGLAVEIKNVKPKNDMQCGVGKNNI